MITFVAFICSFASLMTSFWDQGFIPNLKTELKSLLLLGSVPNLEPVVLKKGMVKASKMQGQQQGICYTGDRLAFSQRVQTKGKMFPSTRIIFACEKSLYGIRNC